MQAAQRVAKNTIILYVRMAITVFISLYSTRIILLALGVADFGLFNLVGGMISMLGFLNSSMAAATQRFMSFAHGAGDVEKVKRIFNMSSLLHWGIAFLVLLLLEGVGYYFFHFVLNISSDRISAAKLIYQFMVLSTLFTVISVPYEAVITSHENMMVFAVLGIIEAVLKLGIALFISYTSMDHLVLYGFLMALLSISLLIIRRIYCHRKYAECKLNPIHYYDKPLLKEISGFAGWSLLGSSSNMIVNYGQGILLNVFFGAVVNSAQGISQQISGQLNVFASTLIKALKPIIDKQEGAGDRNSMLKVALMGSKVSFYLLMFLYIPFLIELPYIFNLWLNNVPKYSIIFCSLLLLRNLIEQLFIPLVAAISAEGNIKGYQKSSSILLLFPLFISYVLFQYNYPPFALYILFVIYSVIASCIILYYAHKNCQLSIKIFFKKVILKCLGIFLVVYFIAYIPLYFLKESLIRLFLVGLLSMLFLSIFVYFFGFSKEEILKIKLIFKRNY
jgi:O-antigen/teichoic acid export membrane protein